MEVKALTTLWFNANVQSGTIHFVNAAAILVTFPTAFTIIPHLALTLRFDPGSSKRMVQTYGTTTQFTISFGAVVTGDVDWIAIQR